MAFEEALRSVSFPAGADLSADQYKMVKVNSSGQVVLAGEGDEVTGILQDAPAASGRVACVGIAGGSKVRAGGSVTAGARFTVNSSGLAVALGSGDDYAVGIARETFASGGIYSCIIQPTGKERSALA